MKYASAHPGNTDSSGGHYCWTDCEYWGYSYGEYHYHNGGYYEEPDYYEQGVEFGSGEGLDNNRDYITTRAESEGRSTGYQDGISGSEQEYLPEAPGSICDLEFDFSAGAYQDYIDGVNDSFSDSCGELANDTFSQAYSEGYSEGSDIYLANQEKELQAETDNKPSESTTESDYGWIIGLGSVVAFYGFAVLVDSWSSIKEWWRNL